MKTTFFHVTPVENLQSIMKNGLQPQIGDRSEQCGEKTKAIYLFHSLEDVDNALYNWLGECFLPDIDLAILQIEIPEDFPIIMQKDSNGDIFFESVCYEEIPAEHITKIYDEMYKSETFADFLDIYKQEFKEL